MRLNARNVTHEVVAIPGTERPIRLRIGGLAYALYPAEAVAVATDLADAITQLRNEGEQR